MCKNCFYIFKLNESILSLEYYIKLMQICFYEAQYKATVFIAIQPRSKRQFQILNFYCLKCVV